MCVDPVKQKIANGDEGPVVFMNHGTPDLAIVGFPHTGRAAPLYLQTAYRGRPSTHPLIFHLQSRPSVNARPFSSEDMTMSEDIPDGIYDIVGISEK